MLQFKAWNGMHVFGSYSETSKDERKVNLALFSLCPQVGYGSVGLFRSVSQDVRFIGDSPDVKVCWHVCSRKGKER